MIQLLALAFSLFILTCFFVLCSNVSQIVKLLKQNISLQHSMLQRLGVSKNSLPEVHPSIGKPRGCVYIYDSRDRGHSVKPVNGDAYLMAVKEKKNAGMFEIQLGQVQMEIALYGVIANKQVYTLEVHEKNNWIDLAEII